MWKFKVLLLVGPLVSSSACAVVALHPLVVPGDKDSFFEPTLAATAYTITAEADQTQLTIQVLKTGGRYLLDIYCPSARPKRVK
jgi:hypothetical protein